MEKKTSTERVRAFRERKRANKPPKKAPKTNLERNREFRARRKALKEHGGQHNLPTTPNTLDASIASIGEDTVREANEKSEGKEKPVIKQEPPDEDTSSLDATSTVKTEPADINEDVYSLENETPVKVEIEIDPTVVQPPDSLYVLRPCKPKPVEDTTAGTSYTVKTQDDCASDTACSTISDQVDYNYKLYHCDTCDTSFKYSSALKRHKSSHTGERPFTCEICKKCFTQESNLTRHIRSHTGEQPYNCKICNKRFTTSSQVMIHTMIHTGERPHNCEICNKRFIRLGDLKRHTSTHTGERPYFVCEICNKRFTSRSHLMQHTMIHTGEKPYNCEICNRRFTQRSDLKQHMRTHTGERPYICKICNKGYTNSSSLCKHIKTHKG